MSATCGCCAGVHTATPRPTENRHGLTAIAYRAGDWASFKRSMVATLAGTPRDPDDLSKGFPLERLTPDDDDFSIALLDAWAIAGDVLTFYQERIANESYLRTAGERLSVVELTRLIGYELAPGVAANAWLAFTVDASEGAPGRVRIDAGSKVQSVPGQDEQPHTFETSAALDARAVWNELATRKTAPRPPASGHTDIVFAGTKTNLAVGDGLLFFKNATSFDFRRVASVTPDFESDRTRVTWTLALTTMIDAGPGETVTVFAMRVQASLFGHNAQDPRTFSSETTTAFATSLTDSNTKWKFQILGATIFLEGEHPDIHPTSHVILQSTSNGPTFFSVSSATLVTKSDFAVTGKATQLDLTAAATAFGGDTEYRSTTAFAASEALDLADYPLSGNIGRAIVLDHAIDTFEEGRAVILASADGSTAEVAFVATIDQKSDPAHTHLGLVAPPANAYDLRTVRIFANVAAATHGETVREVLGSGDASAAFQRFALSHVPLTYVHDPTARGGAGATLSVFVNDIRWTERPTLYGAGPSERVYTVERDDAGKTYVQFGDGRTTGARLPTGSDNVRAVYRKGLGIEGNVAAHKLTLLMSRPLGLEGVDNARPAEGGADAEALEQARTNAPRTVLTLDRVVSLTDYQAFAASFAGVAKAIATWSRDGTAWQVFLSIAGPGGTTFAADSETVQSLREALLRRGDPFVPLRIASFHPAPFFVTARVAVDADRIAEKVLAQVDAALRDAFSFDARAFAEAVDLSDVIAVMHSVPGVHAVDVDFLYRKDDSAPSRRERLPAAKPKQFADGFHLAEILILEKATLTEAR